MVSAATVVVSPNGATSPAAEVVFSVVAIAAATTASHPTSAGDPLVHEGHSVEKGTPPFVPSSLTAVINGLLGWVWLDLSKPDCLL